MTDVPPAPDDILSFVRCKCKTSCMSMLCSCRRNKLTCVGACHSSQHVSCSNSGSQPPPVRTAYDDNGSNLNYADDLDDELIYDSDVDWLMEEVVECADYSEESLLSQVEFQS
jgi:hypothetical protein